MSSSVDLGYRALSVFLTPFSSDEQIAAAAFCGKRRETGTNREGIVKNGCLQ